MKYSIVTAAALTVVCSATHVHAASLLEKAEFNAPADKVWAALGDFCGISNWHPAVAKCELSAEGKVRTLTLAGDGGTIVEALTSWDPAAMSYGYTITEPGPLPVANYASTIKVIANGDKSMIEWSSTFDPKGASEADAMNAMSGVYKAGFEKLAKGF
jgi:hypothetical protein